MKLLAPFETFEPTPEPEGELDLGPDATPLDFFCAVFRDPTQPMQRRMRAAEGAAAYMHPKLAVTASISAADFANRLEAEMVRIGKPLTIGGTVPARH
jgi:hypothetical protein